MDNARGLVATILYGAGMHRRFTQEVPVLPDVWGEYLDKPDGKINLLIEPWIKRSPTEVTEHLRRTMGEQAFDRDRIVYNRTTVAASMALVDLVAYIVPLTGWYVRLGAAPEGKRRSRKKPSDHKQATSQKPNLPTVDEMWEDVVRPAVPRYPHPGLLAFVRVVGLIAYLAASKNEQRTERESELQQQLEKLRRSQDGSDAEQARLKLAGWALQGWLKLRQDLPRPEKHGLVYSVSRNRPASLALTYSVKTVKGDAARQLFSIKCDQLTWAIVDCGIDATHPAFLDRSEDFRTEPRTELQRLQLSRVVQTFDFTHLMDVLSGQLPLKHHGRKVSGSKDRLETIAQRIRRSQAIDWELLRPLLEVPHTDVYLKNKPTDSHGTHVAGILAADWPRDGDPIVGMCPDLKLIDVRVCRPDGSSDEFIIMSALQFLRYLNANVDKPYIQGVNLSISIPHDVATYACGRTPICEEVERSVASGMVAVVAAGNLGYRRASNGHDDNVEEYAPITITDPGNADSAITVGSTHRIEPHTYGVSYFSSRGPTGDGRAKPDLLAPGEKILAPALDDKSARLDGTSMAAPHVSGAAAMLMARHLELQGNPLRIKKILCSTATDLGRERYFQASGLVDVLRAIQSV